MNVASPTTVESLNRTCGHQTSKDVSAFSRYCGSINRQSAATVSPRAGLWTDMFCHVSGPPSVTYSTSGFPAAGAAAVPHFRTSRSSFADTLPSPSRSRSNFHQRKTSVKTSPPSGASGRPNTLSISPRFIARFHSAISWMRPL